MCVRNAVLRPTTCTTLVKKPAPRGLSGIAVGFYGGVTTESGRVPPDRQRA